MRAFLANLDDGQDMDDTRPQVPPPQLQEQSPPPPPPQHELVPGQATQGGAEVLLGLHQAEQRGKGGKRGPRCSARQGRGADGCQRSRERFFMFLSLLLQERRRRRKSLRSRPVWRGPCPSSRPTEAQGLWLEA